MRRVRLPALTSVVLAVLATAAPAGLQAQPKLEAWLESDRVALGRTVDLVVEIEGGVGSLPEPRLASMPGVSLVGRSKSSGLAFGGGGVRRKAVFRYTLLPIRPGTVRIPPVRIRSGGRTVSSRPLRLVVTGRSGIRRRGEYAGDRGSDPPSVFAVTRLDRRASWVGEQVILTFAFYHDPDVPLAESPDYDPPETPGFWRVEIDDEPRVSREAFGGRTYHVQRFRYALFPLRAGELVVGPARVRVVRPDRVEWWRPGHARTLTTDPIRLEVAPLPPGAPAGFDGAIGRYDLAGGVRDTLATEGIPIELEVVVEGRGNPTAMAAPVLPSWPDVTVHPPTVESALGGDRSGVTGSKTFRYLLVPRREGLLDLGTARLPYFDPSRDAYVVDTLRLGEITVAPPVPGALAAEEETPPGPTLWPPRAPVVPGTGDVTRRGWFWGALVAPWLVGIVAAGWTRRRRDRRDGDLAEARSRLAGARRAVEAGDEEAAARAGRAIDAALETGWRVRLAGLAPGERRAALEEAGVPSAVRAAAEAARAELAASAYAGEPGRHAARALARLEALLPSRSGSRSAARIAGSGLGLLLIASASVSIASRPDRPVEAWRDANRAYRAGDFGEAIVGYRGLAARHADPRLEANLAAALWRADRRGAAVARYRRALALEPRNRTMRRDLATLERELDDPPVTTSPGEAALGWTREDELARILLLVNALAAGLVFTASGSRRRRTVAVGGVVATASLAAVTLVHDPITRPGDRAVALTDLPITARAEGPTIGRLPEGSLVVVLEREDGAWRIRVPDRPAGWVAGDRMAPLDFDPRPPADR